MSEGTTAANKWKKGHPSFLIALSDTIACLLHFGISSRIIPVFAGTVFTPLVAFAVTPTQLPLDLPILSHPPHSALEYTTTAPLQSLLNFC
jgi:hypothetical protein